MDMLTIRQKLHDYINVADDAAIEEMFLSIKDISVGQYEWWNDKELVTELDRIADDMDSGKDKGFTREGSKNQLLARLGKNG